MAVTEKQLANLKPPVKGEIRNPNGRGKGNLSPKTIIRKWLEYKDKFSNQLTGKEETLPVMDDIIISQIIKARGGDVAAFNALMDRLEGKPKQNMGFTDGDDNDINPTIFLRPAPNCDPLKDE